MKNITIQTGVARLSYAHIFEPRPNQDDPTNLKYTASIIIPKSDTKTLKRFQDAIAKLRSDPEARGVWGGTDRGVHEPLRDGDTDETKAGDPTYQNTYFCNASSTKKPKVFNKDRTEVMDPEDVYSGCYCQFMLNLFCYNHAGKKGIGVGLNAIRKIKDGEPLSGIVVTGDSWDDDLIDEKDLKDAEEFL